VHAEAEVQATALRKASRPVGAGLKVGTIRQVRPFHRSARVPLGVLPGGSMLPPTAMHADGEVHDTAVSRHPPPGGFGVGWMRHLLPFHCSASVPDGTSALNGLP
jgi:hypothetical protein